MEGSRFNHWIPIGLATAVAGLLTGLSVFGLQVLQETKLDYFHSIFLKRGLIPLILLYLFYFLPCLWIAAMIFRTRTPLIMRMAVYTSVLPLLIGSVGTWMRYPRSEGGWQAILNAEQVRQSPLTFVGYVKAVVSSFDIFTLTCLLTLCSQFMLILFAAWYLRRMKLGLFGYFAGGIIGISVTASVMVITRFMTESHHHVYEMVWERGPLPPWTIATGTSLLFIALVAYSRGLHKPWFLTWVGLVSMMPLLFGLLATGLGLGQSMAGASDFLMGTLLPEQIAIMQQSLQRNMETAWDTTQLALIPTILILLAAAGMAMNQFHLRKRLALKQKPD